MGDLRNLAKETAIYGASSIVGKFLNYLLVPVYTLTLPAQSGGYGVITNMYALVALLLVLLTFGMETGFFRFANKGEDDPGKVYSTALLMVATVSLTFLVVTLALLKPLANVLGYGSHPWYLGMMLIVLVLDAIQAIPFAYLRYKNRPVTFAALKLLFIVVSIGLNILYFVVLKGRDVGAAFLINLVCSCLVMICLLPQFAVFRLTVDKSLMRRMLTYSFPILILGVAGILNQVVDKIIFPFVYPDPVQAPVQLGIYGASVKIAMIMAMCTQAFRFAYEPFVFGKSRDSQNTVMYAQAMKFFIVFAFLAFLIVMFYLDVIRFLIGKDYWEGLSVVPVVMVAEIFMGVYFNLSFWYKLTDNTRWGAYFSLIACTVVVVMNVCLIPRFSYMACAWAGFAGYGTAMLLSYFVGRKKYPIPYDLKGIGRYTLLCALLYALGCGVEIPWMPVRLAYRTLLLLIFVAYLFKHDLPPSRLPLIGRLIRKYKT